MDITIINIKFKKFITYRQPKLTAANKLVSQYLLKALCTISKNAFFRFAKHQSETNKTTHRYINIMEAQHSINFILAEIKLGNRRMRRSNQAHTRLVATSKNDGCIRVAFGWIIDYMLFVLDLIWGVIQPIFLILLMLIIRIVMTIFFTSIGFYLLLKLITS